jgi:NADH-quinone oxidoreductase subunit N
MNAILALAIFGILNLFLGFLENRKLLITATIVFILIALGLNIADWNKEYLWFNNMLKTNNLTLNFANIILIAGLFVVGISRHFGDDKEHTHPAEYYSIMLFALAGAIMMTNYENLIMLFIGLEVLSVSLYVLTGTDKRNFRSNEAALKYFLMGAFATGILLFGITLIYGATGSFNINAIGNELATKKAFMGSMVYVGISMMLIGLLFKVSIAPFHFWTPDVYEGAPTLFTAFMSTVVKTAGFAAIYRITTISFANTHQYWWAFMIILTVITLLISNITAAYQSSFKRMMAYSSISHAAYLLIPVIAKSQTSASAILFYSMSYTLATITAFAVFILVSEANAKDGSPNEDISIFNGLSKNNPLLSICLTVSMLSLAGIPLTAGFWGKFFVFSNAIDRHIIWLLIYAILMSAVGIYYYFKPIINIYQKTGNETAIQIPMLYKIVLIICTLATIILGIMPDLLKSIY